MRKFLILFALTFSCLSAHAQLDTIYSAGKQIPCTVKEVAADVIKFVYPDEDLLNSLSINAIEKIVFKSGRVQTFANSSPLKKLTSPEDYEKIAFAQMESELAGLYKIGETNAKAKGTTEFANQERVKQRAMRKLKQKAAMMGGNVIYMLNMRSEGNKSGGAVIATSLGWGGAVGGGDSAETSLTGIVYTNSLPSEQLFRNNFADSPNMKIKQAFKLSNSDSDYSVSSDNTPVEIQAVHYENGFIDIVCKMGKNAIPMKVSYVNDNCFYAYYTDKNTIYCYRFEK